MSSWPRGHTARSWPSLLALLLGACGGESDPSVPTEISLNTATLAFTSVGATQQLTATVVDQRGDPLSGAAVTWTSSNEVVATVSATGLVTATGPGSAEITASSGEASTTADVSVTQVLTTFDQVSGNGQAAVAGQPLAQPLVVRARDAIGSAIANLTVHFEATQGGGLVTPQEIQTGPDGTASAVFTLGETAGQPQEVVASVVGTESNTTFTATATNPAAVIEVVAGNGQSAPAGGIVPVAPAVRALDADDQPVPGVLVRFEVTSGGGAVAGAAKATNAAGIATLDSWTLGPSGINTLTVSVEGQTVSGEPLTFVATVSPTTGYDIKIRYVSSPTSAQLLAFAEAELRWERLITGDLPGGPVNVPPDECGEGTPTPDENIDDLVILVTFATIDGPLQVVAQAGPCLIRDNDGDDQIEAGDLPIVGVMIFDVDDLDFMEENGLLTVVALHEMGHVIGFGALWASQGLLADPSLPPTNGTDPHFTGAQAITAFDGAGGTSYNDGEKVPVEDTGGPGTADSHWRESVFDDELMTGDVDFGANPLSRITVASFADQGYAVDPSGADAFSLNLPGLRAARPVATLRLGNDIAPVPIRMVDPSGRITRTLKR